MLRKSTLLCLAALLASCASTPKGPSKSDPHAVVVFKPNFTMDRGDDRSSPIMQQYLVNSGPRCDALPNQKLAATFSSLIRGKKQRRVAPGETFNIYASTSYSRSFATDGGPEWMSCSVHHAWMPQDGVTYEFDLEERPGGKCQLFVSDSLSGDRRAVEDASYGFSCPPRQRGVSMTK